MVRLLIAIVVINFNTQHQTIEPTPQKEEFKQHYFQEQDQSPFKDKVEKELHSAFSGSVALQKIPQLIQEKINENSFIEYHITSLYNPSVE